MTLEGSWVGATALLRDLRSDTPRLGIPCGPNSGLTVRLPRVTDGMYRPLLAVTWPEEELDWAA